MHSTYTLTSRYLTLPRSVPRSPACTSKTLSLIPTVNQLASFRIQEQVVYVLCIGENLVEAKSVLAKEFLKKGKFRTSFLLL